MEIFLLRILTVIILVGLFWNLSVVFFTSSDLLPTSLTSSSTHDAVKQYVVNLELLSENNVIVTSKNENAQREKKNMKVGNKENQQQLKSGVKSHEIHKDKQLLIDDKQARERFLVPQRNSFLQSKQNVRGRLNVYYFQDTCSDYNFDDVYSSNVLFPHFPSNGGWMNHVEDEKLLTIGQARHVIGFLTPTETASYRFQLSTRLGAEVILIEDNSYPIDKTYDKFLLRFGVYNSQVLKENDPKFPENLFIAQSNLVNLEKGKFYMVDIIHAIPVYGMFKLRWKQDGGDAFEVIPPSQLYSLYSETMVDKQFPDIKYTSNHSIINNLLKDPRNDLDIPVIKTGMKLKSCNYKPDYISDYIKPGYGTWYIQIDKIYPSDPLVIEHNKDAKKLDLFIDPKTANEIAEKYVLKNLDR